MSASDKYVLAHWSISSPMDKCWGQSSVRYDHGTKQHNPGIPCERKLPACQHYYVAEVFGMYYGWPYAEVIISTRLCRRARLPNEILWSDYTPMAMTVLRGYNNHVLLIPQVMSAATNCVATNGKKKQLRYHVRTEPCDRCPGRF